MPAQRIIDWDEVVEAWRHRAPGTSKGDLCRRFKVSHANLNRRLSKCGFPAEVVPDNSLKTDPTQCSFVIPAAPEQTRRVVSSLMRRASAEAVSLLTESFQEQAAQFQAEIHSDVLKLRERAHECTTSEDPRMVLAGVEMWSRAIAHGRLNLGLPSEIVAQDHDRKPILSISKASGSRRLL